MTNHTILDREIHRKRFVVTVFGSARTKAGQVAWEDAYELGKGIAKQDLDLVTGGGPGNMEAVSKGHSEGKAKGSDARTMAINIKLPFEQSLNPYVEVAGSFDHFSERLDHFMAVSSLVVITEGGVGTMLELAYTWQLLQVGQICKIPIVVVGDMWHKLLKWSRENQVKGGFVSPEDFETIYCVRDASEAMRVIRKAKKAWDDAGKDVCINWKMYKL